MIVTRYVCISYVECYSNQGIHACFAGGKTYGYARIKAVNRAGRKGGYRM